MNEPSPEEFDEGRLENSIPFDYPNDEPEIPPDPTQELLLHLIFSLLTVKNPKLKLCALSYCYGIDLSYILQCESSISDIARKLGVSKQLFHKEIKKVCTEYHLDIRRVQGHKQNTAGYRYSNFINHKGHQ